MVTSPRTDTRRGMSLAKGPALLIGTVLDAAGLYFLFKQHAFLPWSNFPSGHAPTTGNAFFGVFGVNGWTGMFTAVCGGLLLFGAAQHHLAKVMGAIVGVALAAAVVISLVQGNVLGMAATNVPTELGWAACAVILLLNLWAPRRTHTVTTTGPPVTERTLVDLGPPAASDDRETVVDPAADG